MIVELTDDQRMLAESLEAWLGREYRFEDWRRNAESHEGCSAKVWAQFAEMGWLAAPLPEAHGGLGSGAIECMLIGQAFGAALVLEPYLSTVVVGAGLVARAGTQQQQADLLPQVAGGKLKLAFAFAEHGARFTLNDVCTSATGKDGGYVLNGRKLAVWDAPQADVLIVLARTSGGQRDDRGLGLFLVPAAAAGVQMIPYAMVDRRRGANVTFDGVRAQAVLGDAESALGVVEEVVDQALGYLAAEACGAMQTLNAQTVEYLRQRKQFGLPLAQFQVLRHRMVDMTIELECTKSLALHAAAAAGLDAPVRALAAAAAKVRAGRAGRFVGQQAVQLHGGMGMTQELAIGQYMKRLMMIDMAYGNADHHQQRFARLAREAECAVGTPAGA